jgi:hypothetical protein
VDEGGDGALHALVEIAKYYEHVERDYGPALDAVHHALALSELQGRSDVAGLEELEHRLGRLQIRSARSRGTSRRRV